MMGISCLQGGHQVAQKSMTTTFPAYSDSETVPPATDGRVKSGAIPGAAGRAAGSPERSFPFPPHPATAPASRARTHSPARTFLMSLLPGRATEAVLKPLHAPGQLLPQGREPPQVEGDSAPDEEEREEQVALVAHGSSSPSSCSRRS